MLSFWNANKSAPIDARVGSRFTKELNGVGSGRLVLGLEDDAQVSQRDSIVVLWGDEPVFWFEAERDEAEILVPLGDGSVQTVVWTGRGLAHELDSWKLGAPNGNEVPRGLEHRFDWATESIGSWGTCYNRGLVGDRASLPPHGLGGMPAGFPNPLTYWIAPRPASHLTGNDPAGVWYAGKDFTLAEDMTVLMFWMADDRAQIAVDGVLVDQYADSEGIAMGAIQVIELDLKAGSHSVRVKAENVARGSGVKNNCGLFAAAMCSKEGLDGIGFNIDWLWTTAAANGWKTLDYGAAEPGFTWGQIVESLISQAKAESTMSLWSESVSGSQDSALSAWPVVQHRFPASMSPLDVLGVGVAAGEIMWRTSGRRLDVWKAGTSLGSCTVPLSELQSMTVIRDVSGTAGRVRSIADDGVVRTRGSVGRMAWSEMGGVDPSRVLSLSQAQLDRLAAGELSVTVGIPVGGSVDPFVAWDVGWSLVVPKRSLSGTESLLVMAVTCEVQAGGVPRVEATLRSLSRHRLELAELAVDKVLPGLRSETTAPSAPGQRLGRRMDPWVHTFSWSGAAEKVEEKLSSPAITDGVVFCTQLELWCNDAGGGSTGTLVQGKVNGVAPSVPGVGAALLTAGSSGVGQSVVSSFVWQIQPQKTVTLELLSSGKHKGGTARLLGMELPPI